MTSLVVSRSAKVDLRGSFVGCGTTTMRMCSPKVSAGEFLKTTIVGQMMFASISVDCCFSLMISCGSVVAVSGLNVVTTSFSVAESSFVEGCGASSVVQVSRVIDSGQTLVVFLSSQS